MFFQQALKCVKMVFFLLAEPVFWRYITQIKRNAPECSVNFENSTEEQKFFVRIGQEVVSWLTLAMSFRNIM